MHAVVAVLALLGSLVVAAPANAVVDASASVRTAGSPPTPTSAYSHVGSRGRVTDAPAGRCTSTLAIGVYIVAGDAAPPKVPTTTVAVA